jgi:hypothetical protein
MNKILCALMFVFFSCACLSAQEPEGKYSLELNLNPAALFVANAGPMFQMPNIKARYFTGSDLAFRLGIGFGFSNDKNYTDTEGNDYTKTSSTNFTFSPGVEKEFGGDKFVGYIGADLPLTSYSSKSETKVGDNTIKTKNPNSSAYFGVGLDIVFGFDYYILSHVFIGAELSPGLMFQKYSDTVIDGTTTNKGGTGLNFSLSSSSGIRLGVRF